MILWLQLDVLVKFGHVCKEEKESGWHYQREGFKKILSANEILHYNFHIKEELMTDDYLPKKTGKDFNHQWRFLPGCIGGGGDK